MFDALLMPTKSISISEYEIHYYDFGLPKNDNQNSLYMQSQLHGNETFGSLVLFELLNRLNELEKDAFCGSIRIAPSVNPFSWNNYAFTNEGMYDLPSGSNWNRIFNIKELIINSDGEIGYLNREETETIIGTEDTLNEGKENIERFAEILLVNSLGYDYIIDVHTPELGLPHLYCQLYSKDIPTFGISNIIEYITPQTNSFDECHVRFAQNNSKKCIPITLELPNYSAAIQNDVEVWTDVFMNELVKNGLIKKEYVTYFNYENINSATVPQIGNIYDYIPKSSGIILYHFNPGDMVEKDSPLVSIIPMRYNKKHVETIFARKKCLPISFRKKTIAQSGTWVIRAWE